MKTNGLAVLADFEECPCAGRTLDKLIQPAILVVLAEGPLHGYRLAERIGELSMFGGQKPDASGVYRFLKTMERRGMVASSWGTLPPAMDHDAGGVPRGDRLVTQGGPQGGGRVGPSKPPSE